MLCMKFLRNFCLLAVALVALLCGCCSEKVEPKAELKAEPMAASVATLEAAEAEPAEPTRGLPADTLLYRAFRFYELFKASNSSEHRNSMNVHKNLFFARWRTSSDSICATIPADDSLAADLRDIYKAVLEFDAKRKYRDILDREERDIHEDTLNETRKIAKPIDPIDVDEVFKRWNSDSMRTVRERADSIYAVKIRAIPLDEALNRLSEDSSSIYNYAYFVQTLEVLYVDTAVADMKELDKVNIFSIKREEWKEAKSACMGKSLAGQRRVVLNKEYNTLLNNFMKANVRESRSDRYTIMPNKYPFWHPFINVIPEHWGDDYHFNSFPVIHNAVFNKAHDMVQLNVMQSFNSGSYYYLSKRSGKWEVVRRQDGWVM